LCVLHSIYILTTVLTACMYNVRHSYVCMYCMLYVLYGLYVMHVLSLMNLY
jgi:hypothetical protein